MESATPQQHRNIQFLCCASADSTRRFQQPEEHGDLFGIIFRQK